MSAPPTLTKQTRQRVWAAYAGALWGWAHGQSITAAAVHSHVDDILDDAFAAERNRVINDTRLQDE